MNIRLFLILLLPILGLKSPDNTVRPGKDYAIFFAVDSYGDSGWRDLKNPIRDAEAIAKELREMYGFETFVYKNPSKSFIRNTLIEWREKSFSPNSQLLVFFSGHGTFNDDLVTGYFVPKAGKSDDRFNETHLSLPSIGNQVTQIPCNHILLAIDACYSGTIDQEIAFKGDTEFTRPNENKETEKQRIISRHLRNKTRLLITSGGKERTPDGGNHSPFTEAILKGLRRAYSYGDGLLTYGDLLGYLERVSPMPHTGELREHEDGSFVFISTEINSTSDPISTHDSHSKEDIPISPDPNETTLPKVNSDTENALLDQIPYPMMIPIQGGRFEMGSNHSDEKPIHWVNIKTFFLGETEVTNEQFSAFLNEMGNQKEGGSTWIELEAKSCQIEKSGSNYQPKSGKGNYPVVKVSWYGAVSYCEWLSEKTSRIYRLPSEAEWEYAAGGGEENRTTWAGTNDEESLDDYAGLDGEAPVKSKKPNQLGLYDMAGNVWEWCQDKWHSSYRGAPDDGSAWEDGDTFQRVSRGAGYGSASTFMRVTYRNDYSPESRYSDMGFRVVRTR